EALSFDPARGISDAKSREEAKVGLALERAGIIKSIVRDPSGASEFISSTNGTAYDVKSFRSDFPPEKGGFTVEASLDLIRKEVRATSVTIINTEHMTAAHTKELFDAITRAGLQKQVLWYPDDVDDCFRLNRLKP